MIKYNNKTISDWYLGDKNIVKVYRNGAVCYYKIGGGSTPSQTPCFAVVDDISQYQETEFEDVYNNADGKWYKLNNLDQYEKYGVYGEGRNITYYEGKLTIDGDYEYEYSGNAWVNIGEVSGSSRLPQGYTEVEYISSENISSGVNGPYISTNFYPNQNTRVVLDYQPTKQGQNNRRIFGSGRFNYTSTGNYIWSMENKVGASNCYYYYKFDNGSSWLKSTVHPDTNRHVVDFNNNGKILLDDTAIITLPNNTVTCSYPLGIFNEINNETLTSNYENLLGRVFSCQIYDNGTLARDLVPCKNPNDVVGLYDIVNGVFYGSQNSYTFSAGADAGGLVVYPKYYDEISDPEDNVVFADMAEAEAYQCPWVGQTAIISGVDYIFIDSYQWQEKYVWQVVADSYLCVNGDKYQKLQKYERNDDGTLTPVVPADYMAGELIEAGSSDCEGGLPDVAFTINYNAKEYDANTKTLPKTLGQLADMDAVITAGTPTVGNGYLTIAQNTRATITGYQEYLNRDNDNPTLTIIAKVYPINNSSCHLFANRGNTSSYNWMFRTETQKMYLHGSSSSEGQIAITNRPAIVSVRVDSNRLATYNNWTDQTSSTYSSYSYGGTNSTGTALFAGYYSSSTEWFTGDFYWIYMSQNTLTDEQVQQVIDYNENL